MVAVLDPLRPRSAEAPARGAAWALAAHGLLLAALSLGVSWRMVEPQAGEAELWAAIPQAAPAPGIDLPRSEVPPPAEPGRPEPTPDPVRPEPVAESPRQPAELQEATRVPPPPRKPDPPLRVEPQDKLNLKPRPQTAPQPARPSVPQPKSPAEPRLKSSRDEALNRMFNELGAASGGGTARSSKPAAGRATDAYAGRIKARILPNIVFTELVSGNPEAVVRVRGDASGRIVSVRLMKSSGHPGWDEAVQRAIVKTEVLPLDEDGRSPDLELSFRPNDR